MLNNQIQKEEKREESKTMTIRSLNTEANDIANYQGLFGAILDGQGNSLSGLWKSILNSIFTFFFLFKHAHHITWVNHLF